MKEKILKIELKNCHGIKSLEETFDFKNKNAFVIYATNGSMKTSLTKTFLEYSKGDKITKNIFSDDDPFFKINFLNLEKKNILAIESFENILLAKPDKINTLLTNEKLRKSYEKTTRKLNEQHSILLSKIFDKFSDLNLDNFYDNPIFSNFFNNKEFYKKLNMLVKNNFLFEEKKLSKLVEFDLKKIDFSIIGSAAFQKFIDLKKNDFIEYKKIISNSFVDSKYFNEEFGYLNMISILKNLKLNNFFALQNSIILFNKKEQKKDEFNSLEVLTKEIEKERKKIFENSLVKKELEKIHKNLQGNKESRKIDLYLTENGWLINELDNLEDFLERILFIALSQEEKLCVKLLKVYNNTVEELKSIHSEIKSGRSEWENLIEKFNLLFKLPFSLKVDNKEDVILRSGVASIYFVYEKNKLKKELSQEEIEIILSRGEKKALFFLNIMYEIEIFKKNNDKKLIILDDIVDSFDYKNKYAIIEYLDELLGYENFYLIFLTHNFDFFRTLSERVISTSKNSLIVEIDSELKVNFKMADYIINKPFNYWKKKLNKAKYFIPFMLFLRKVIEYTNSSLSESAHYNILSNIFNYKGTEIDYTVDQVKKIFKKNNHNANELDCKTDEKIYDFVQRVATGLLEDKDGINFEEKIILSLAIKMMASKFLRTIAYPECQKEFKQLLKNYKKDFHKEEKKIQILKKVNLMIPGNVHLNSFMYEPIIDMGYSHLVKLYREVAWLENNKSKHL